LPEIDFKNQNTNFFIKKQMPFDYQKIIGIIYSFNLILLQI